MSETVTITITIAISAGTPVVTVGEAADAEEAEPASSQDVGEAADAEEAEPASSQAEKDPQTGDIGPDGLRGWYTDSRGHQTKRGPRTTWVSCGSCGVIIGPLEIAANCYGAGYRRCGACDHYGQVEEVPAPTADQPTCSPRWGKPEETGEGGEG